MTPEAAHIWNQAIQAAILAYPEGRGKIAALRIPITVTVEHIGEYQTKQEWVVGNAD